MTPELTVQAEYRRRETEHGDLLLNFGLSDFSTLDRRELHQDTYRVGVHYAPARSLDLLGSFLYSEREEQDATFDPDANTTGRLEDTGYQAEAQALFRTEYLSVITGFATYSIDASQFLVFDITPAFGGRCPPEEVPCVFPFPADFTRERNNGYAYAHFQFPRNVVWTLGASYDAYKEGNFEIDELEPKFGLQWDVPERLRVRMAFLETVKPALVVQQSIEPTHVAGFNQLFDVTNGTRAERYGIGIDAQLFDGLFAGVEASHRDLEVSIFDPGTLIAELIEDHEEDLYLASCTGRHMWTGLHG